MDIVPEPAIAFALSVVDVPLHIGLAAKSGDAVGLALKLKTADVAATVQPLLLVTVTVNGPAVDTVPLALLPAIPDDHA